MDTSHAPVDNLDYRNYTFYAVLFICDTSLHGRPQRKVRIRSIKDKLQLVSCRQRVIRPDHFDFIIVELTGDDLFLRPVIVTILSVQPTSGNYLVFRWFIFGPKQELIRISGSSIYYDISRTDPSGFDSFFILGIL